jgi:hypothetical protein
MYLIWERAAAGWFSTNGILGRNFPVGRRPDRGLPNRLKYFMGTYRRRLVFNQRHLV